MNELGCASSKAASSTWTSPTTRSSSSSKTTVTVGRCKETACATSLYGTSVIAVNASDDDDLWEAIVDPTRRKLLDLLVAGWEATATTLTADMPVSRQAISKHLGVSCSESG